MTSQLLIGQIVLVLLLIIFTLGCFAIVLCQVNILWRSYFGACRNNQPGKRQLSVQPLALKVVERNDITQRHFSVRLETVNGEPLKSFIPGQYLTLITPNEPIEDSAAVGSLKRCYSLASWQENTTSYELGIQREANGKVSTWLHSHLHLGAVITALPPKGNFVINAKQPLHSVLIAGGIGITPLRAMVHQFIAQHNESSSKNTSTCLFYSAKSVEEMCYLNEFIQLSEECANFSFYPFFSKGEIIPVNSTMGRLSAKKITLQLEQYFSHSPAKMKRSHKENCHFYLCGPNTMMDELKRGLITEGVITGNIHFERFGISYDSSLEENFNVKIGDNTSIIFNQQRSLLDAIEEQGIEIQSECRSGECGQCKVNLRCGKVKPLIEIDMNLKVGEILACCCVPESDLLIDL